MSINIFIQFTSLPLTIFTFIIVALLALAFYEVFLADFEPNSIQKMSFRTHGVTGLLLLLFSKYL